MYENKTERLILGNMLDKITSPVSKIEGTLIYDALSPVSCELAKHYMELDAFIRRSFVQTSHGGFLDMKAAEHEIRRKGESAASALLEFSGTAGTTVNTGFSVQSVGTLIEFRTVRPVTLDENGKGYVEANSVLKNASCNVPEHTLRVMPIPIDGVVSVTNRLPASGGAETETDDELRTRILYTVQNDGYAGSPNAYYRWASEVDGVGFVKVYPLYGGPGTVLISILDRNLNPAGTSLINAVASNVNAKRPIGSYVIVNGGIERLIDIDVTVSVSGSIYTWQQVTDDIRERIEQYFREATFKEPYVSYQKISSLILGSKGVADHTGLKVSDIKKESFTDNITLEKANVPRLRNLIIRESFN